MSKTQQKDGGWARPCWLYPPFSSTNQQSDSVELLEMTESVREVSKMFGSIKLRAIAPREVVCERVVIGKKVIPETLVPARPEELIPAHEEEVVEFHCPHSLLETARIGEASTIGNIDQLDVQSLEEESYERNQNES